VSAHVRLARKGGKRGRIAPTRTLKLTARCDQTVLLTLTGTITSIPKRAEDGKQPKAKTVRIHAVSVQATAGAPVSLTVKVPAAALTPGTRDSASFTLTAVKPTGRARLPRGSRT
jgi:hypothetical protein